MVNNLYLIQFTYSYGNEIIIPYSVGVVWGYANRFEDIKNNYCLKEIIFKREDPEDIVNRLDSPHVVAFSVYVWNFEISKLVANKIKERYPDCLIIFGGPHVPNEVGGFFRKNKYVDILVHGEGEVTFYEILKAKSNKDNIKLIKGLSFNESGACSDYSPRERLADVNDIPSPYLEGVFDELLTLPYNWQPVWETNRGCPYSCTYCDWGSNLVTKMKTFNEGRLFKEIEWFGENEIGFIFGADANFGILKRDLDIAKKLVEENYKTGGFPSKFRVAYAKNSSERVFEIAELLHANNLDKGITLSVQSMNQEALNAIKRKNLSVGLLSDFVKRYKRKNIATYTELIMGLPGESYDSFVDGVEQLLNSGIHDSMSIYHCSILPNAPMNSEEYREKWDIKTAHVPIFLNHSSKQVDATVEYDEIVVGNKMLSEDDWVNEVMFSWVIQTFHALNLTQVIAVLFNHVYGVKYSTFYKEFILYLSETNNNEFFITLKKVKSILNGGDWGWMVEEFGLISWSIEEASYLRVLAHVDDFFVDVEKFLRRLDEKYNINMDYILVADLMRYQYEIIVKFDDFDDARIDLNYSIHSLYMGLIQGGDVDLKKGDFYVLIRNKQSYEDRSDHAKRVLWWGRKGGRFVHDDIEEVPQKICTTL